MVERIETEVGGTPAWERPAPIIDTKFSVVSNFEPTGDQPQAIEKLSRGIQEGFRHQTLLGVTGSGKTFTMAKVIERVQKPTLILSHNKTLAAQLYSEFKEFLPNNAVEYFVSYYDYYQPEAYIARSDTYIEKESEVNEEIDRLRHAATRALFERRDVVIVASVSCIYGIGAPEEYGKTIVSFRKGGSIRRERVLRLLVDIQYERNDSTLVRGTFRVRGDTLEIFPAYEEIALRIELWGDEVERIVSVDPLTGEVLGEHNAVDVYPAKHFVTSQEKLQAAMRDIEEEMTEQVKLFEQQGKLLEAQRIKQRTMYDLEMLSEVGYCAGIENYSRPLARRPPGAQPWTLLDYFPDDYLLIVDESHISLPQVRGMYGGDRSRKEQLVQFGFRLPSALDNRPLTFDEFERHVNQAVYVSATPADYEIIHTKECGAQVVEQVIRPTGLLDPVISVRPTDGQIDDLLEEVRVRVSKGQRALITTLTKRMAEDLTDYLKEMGVKTQYLHHDIETLERIDILRVAPPRRLRCGGRHQPAARGVGPAGSLARRHPRRGQRGLPALEPLADPGQRPRRAPRRGSRHHVRGQRDGLDALRDLGDGAPPRHPGGVQHRARHHAARHHQEYPRPHRPRQSGGGGEGPRLRGRPDRRCAEGRTDAHGQGPGIADEGRCQEPRIREGRPPARSGRRTAPPAHRITGKYLSHRGTENTEERQGRK